MSDEADTVERTKCKICLDYVDKRSVKCNESNCCVYIHRKCFDIVSKVFVVDTKKWRCRGCIEDSKGKKCTRSLSCSDPSYDGGSVKAKLTSLEKFISKTQALNLIERPSIQLIELRFKSSESLLIEFDKIQVAIEEKCLVEHLDEQMVERSNFEERYFAAQAFLSEIIANESQNNVRSLSEADVPRASNHTPQSNYDPLQNVFIPKIKIPTFSGEFKNWISFKNNFHSTILSNWQFLKASLSGYALRVVEGSDSHSQPFTAAWTLLCDKFDKKQFLMDSHFKSLFNLPSVKKENYSQFSLMLDELSVHITALDDLKLTKETLYDSIIIHVASEKLDKSTRREWKDFRQGKELSTLSEFLSFLKDRLDVLQSLEDDQLSNNASAAHHSSKFSSFNKNSQMHLTLNKTIKCNYCKGDHTIFKCSEFLGLSIDQRLQKVKALKLCENCLLTGHETNRCRLQPCSVCKVRGHNSLLHKTKAAHTSSQNSETMNMLVRPNSSTVLDMEHSNQVLLSTIVCQIADYAGGLHTCRALLDSGAQSNLITEGFCSKLNIPLNSTKLSIIGINQTNLLVPRNAVFNNYALKEIHCFCDASKDAYATCIYMRSVNKQGDYNVQLLCAKTKVAPLKSVTIPKLELKLIHVTAFCLRFTYNLKNKLNKHVGILTPHEIDRANFSKQYVSQLHQQYKWKGAPSTVALDSLVLVKNDFQPPCRWPLGRVLQLFPGKDGVSRIAEEVDCLVREKELLAKLASDREYTVELQKKRIADLEVNARCTVSDKNGVSIGEQKVISVSYSQALRSTNHNNPYLIIKSADGSIPSHAIEKDFKSKFSPGSLSVGITKTKSTRNGLLISCNNSEDLATLKDDLQSNAGNRYRISEPTKLYPKLVVYDIPKAFFKQSGSDGKIELVDDFIDKLIFDNKLTCSQTRGYVFLGWIRCRLEEHFHIIRCFKCCKFGHFKKDCRSNVGVCFKCSDSHEAKDCNSTAACCANCKYYNSRLKTNFPIHHFASSSECDSYRMKIQNLKNNITYE
nr:unnamed protein product [Callosobruchus chinensis]